MAEKDPGRDGPSLELPSFGLGRRRRKSEPTATGPGNGQEPTEPEPAPEPFRPEAGPETGQPLHVEEAPPPPGARRERRRPTWPSISGLPASLITGAVVGVLLVGLTWSALRLCEFLRGTSSCGNPGFFLLLAIVIVMVVLGRLLLKAFGVDEPGSTSLLGVGLVVVIALLFLIELLFNWWMVLVIPVVGTAAFALAHWVTTRFAGPVADDSMHR